MDNEWKPTNPDDDVWAEMFPDEIDRERWRTNFGNDSEAAETASYWRDLAPTIEPSVAAIYKKEGLTPYEVGDYTNVGINDFKELLSWKKAQAQPELAGAFKQKGINPDSYSRWAKVGVQDPDTLVRLSDEFKVDVNHLDKYVKPLVDKELIELKDLPKWLEAGVDLRELNTWLEAGFRYPSIVKAWKALRLKPEEAKKWEEVVTYPREAAKWIASGYKNLRDVKGLIKQGYNSPEDIEREAEDLVMKVK